MQCSKCNYVMDDFDKECPRCHGEGIDPPQPADTDPVKTTSTPSPNTPTAKARPTSKRAQLLDKEANLRLLEKVCGIGFMGGIVIAFYFFFLFDPSVAASGFSGRIINIGLMADRQNGILFGFGMSVISAIAHSAIRNEIK